MLNRVRNRKIGILLVEIVNEIIYMLAQTDDYNQRHYLPRIIDLSIKFGYEHTLYQCVIGDLKKSFYNEIDSKSPFASYYLTLYEIAVFVKKDILDIKADITSLTNKIIDSVNDYVSMNAYGCESLLQTALLISRELKDKDTA